MTLSLNNSFLFLYLIDSLFKNFFLSLDVIEQSKYRIGYSSNKLISPSQENKFSEIEIFLE